MKTLFMLSINSILLNDQYLSANIRSHTCSKQNKYIFSSLNPACTLNVIYSYIYFSQELCKNF